MALPRTALTLGLAASLMIHGGAVAWLTHLQDQEEQPMIEGGPGLEMAVAGDPFDAVAEGNETGTTDTATAEPETAEPAEVMEPTEAVQPTETPPEAQTETSEVAEIPEVMEASEVEPEVTEAAEPIQTSELTEAPEVAAIEPQTTSAATVTETVEAMPEQPDNVPQPTRRPPPPPRQVAQEEPAPRQEPRAEPQRERQTRSGNEGRQQTNARQGSQQSGQSARSGGGGSGANATAARSNYSGQILARIRRAQRYPASARSQRAQGTATVAFTVTAGGGASGIRLVGSSGNPSLDRAAVDTVRRASPFPPIPAAAGRRSMNFTVPIRFQLR